MLARDRIGVIAVKHCNLSCAACNHLSPLFEKSFLDPERLLSDLRILAKGVHFEQISIQGGEPLLHPQVDRLLEVARESHVADRVTVLTNGTKLHQMSEEFWKRVDQVRLSVYPGVEVAPIRPDLIQKVEITRFDSFLESFSTKRNEDVALVRRIHSACWLHGRCHAIMDSVFYRCIVGAFIPEGTGDTWAWEPTVDGLQVEEGARFQGRLKNYLESREPLRACDYCCGTSGKARLHRMQARGAWLEPHGIPVQALVDPSLLQP